MKNPIKTKILFILALLFGPMFINAGLNKFFDYMPMPEKLPERMLQPISAFIEIGWLLPLVGFAEILGGLLIIIPKTRALGAFIIFPVMVGIVLPNIVQDTSVLPIASVLVAILAWVMYENRVKYSPLFK